MALPEYLAKKKEEAAPSDAPEVEE